MRITRFGWVGGLVAGLALALMAGSLSGCGSGGETEVGKTLEYDAKEDPGVQKAQEYYEKMERGEVR